MTKGIRKSTLECHSNNFHREETPITAEMSAQTFKQKWEYLHNLKVSPSTYLVIKIGKEYFYSGESQQTPS